MGEEDELPLSVILDENGGGASSILAGRELTGASRAVTLNKNVLRRHAAVLGGSGSGKTTLALCLIEQLLLRGIPAVLIDRKGDLCSYANPDVWRENAEEFSERRGEREKLADAIDVAVFTPGRASGRPISITLLPNGINELPEHEQQLLANLSAAALGEMLHLKNSATHQKQSGTLSVALRILGARHSREVTLSDLIGLLEDEDPELSDLTQRMDPSGKLRRDLVAQLDSLRHRNSALFEAGGESLRMESLLGLGRYAREGRTRLSIIYTGFLGDNENILFWVSQFLSEALRFCQRNPNDELQAVVMFDEADLYIPANAKPATAEPLQSLLKRARSAGLGMMLATQSPGDLDYKSRDQITSWFIGRVREDTALRKLKAAFQSESGLEPAAVLPGQTVGEFHLVQEGLVRPMKAQRSLITAEQVPFDRIEQLARETKGQDERQLRLFDLPSTRK
jgi:DNA helicase HerA-like ATPase